MDRRFGRRIATSVLGGAGLGQADTEEAGFFFEKKNQKTFARLVSRKLPRTHAGR
jgi:hypothetical protein